MMAPNCASLVSYTNFPKYITQLNKTMSYNLTVSAMWPCRSEICSNLFGVGNGDISGIGVITANILELFIGVLLALGVMTLHPKKAKKSFADAVHSAFATYADAALLLTFSIQFAAVVTLIKKDFGISAINFGGLTIEVTWSAALLSMLPLLLPCCIDAELERKELRLGLACLSWVLFFYTFISRMIGTFGASQVGSSGESVLSPGGWDNITELCFSGPSDLTTSESVAFNFFAIGGSLFVSVVVIGLLVWELLDRRQPDMTHQWKKHRLLKLIKSKTTQFFLIFNVSLWGFPQLLAILKFRAIEQALADSIRTSDQDNDWTFGQIISVAVFLPVLIELAYVYMNGQPCPLQSETPKEIKHAQDRGPELLE